MAIAIREWGFKRKRGFIHRIRINRLPINTGTFLSALSWTWVGLMLKHSFCLKGLIIPRDIFKWLRSLSVHLRPVYGSFRVHWSIGWWRDKGPNRHHITNPFNPLKGSLLKTSATKESLSRWLQLIAVKRQEKFHFPGVRRSVHSGGLLGRWWQRLSACADNARSVAQSLATCLLLI